MGVLNQKPDELVLRNETFQVETRISEMGVLAADVGADIPVDPARMAKIKERDSDPKFVVVEIETCEKANGTSKAEWDVSAISQIAEQVNKKIPVGYAGHIPDAQHSTAFPKVQAVWLGATVKQTGKKAVARIKGYLMPKADMRDYIELEAVDGVSVRGDATLMRKEGGGWKVKDFILETIDFSRKGQSGMPTRIVAITSEMEGGNSVEPKDIAAIDESELRAHAPLLVKEIETKATAPFTAKVSEMESAATAVAPKLDAFDAICEKLGITEGENPVEKIVALMEKVEGAARVRVKGLVDQAIAKVAGKDEKAQKLVRRLVGEQIEAEFSDSMETDDKKLAAEIEAKVKEMTEEDDDVQAVISEMSTAPEGGGGAHLGTRSRTNTNEGDDEPKSRTGKVNFSKRTL